MSRAVLLWLVLTALCASGRAEDLPVPAKPPAPGSVQVMFLPPPLETAVYSVGIHEAKTGRLVRRLHEDAEDDAFAAGLNGFITFWDRKDDAGNTVPAGRYAARGWAVGAMRVEGVDILGNDWTAEDEGLRIKSVDAIQLVPEDEGLLVLATLADGNSAVLRFTVPAGKLLWGTPVPRNPTGQRRELWVEGNHFSVSSASLNPSYRLMDGTAEEDRATAARVTRTRIPYPFNNLLFPFIPFPLGEDDSEILPSSGTEGSTWSVSRGKVVQIAGSPVRILRTLVPDPDQPTPRRVAASAKTDRLYVLEETDGWQRVRGLEFSETKRDADGQPVSEWKTFFERSIRRPDPTLGLDEKGPSPVVELPLAKNPLEPNTPQRARLRSGFDARGSYLATADGLRLLPVSTRPNLRAARLARDPQDPGRLMFYQFDGAAWDVFSITGAPTALVGFDAGEFELTADGERRPEPPTDDGPREP